MSVFPALRVRGQGLLTQGAVFGKTTFYGLQAGPTSPGRTWLLSVTNASVTPYTYHEDFSGNTSVLSRDNLKMLQCPPRGIDRMKRLASPLDVVA